MPRDRFETGDVTRTGMERQLERHLQRPTDGFDGNDIAALLELAQAQQATIKSLSATIDAQRDEVGHWKASRDVLAHELRTPLTVVIGILETVLSQTLSAAEADDLLRRALRQSEHMWDVADDLLHSAAPAPVEVARHPQEWIWLGDLVADVAATASVYVEPHCIEIDVPHGLGLNTVPSRLRQILNNLVVNAARYATDERPVTVRARRLLAERAVEIEVLDRGPGVDPAGAEQLFERYQRGPQAAVDGTGLGLGLYVARCLARSLGGDVVLLPRRGGGTNAQVTLPQQRASDRVAKAPAEAEAASPSTTGAGTETAVAG